MKGSDEFNMADSRDGGALGERISKSSRKRPSK